MTHFCNQVPAVAEAFCNSTALFAPDLKEKGAERLSWIGEIAGHYYQQLPTFAEMKTYASNGVDAAINYFPTAKEKLSQAGEYIADTLSDPRTLALICKTAAIALILYASVDAAAREQEKALLDSECKGARKLHKHSASEDCMTRYWRGVQRGVLLGMIAFY